MRRAALKPGAGKRVAILRGMSRPTAFQRSMARLALLAMLALALLPGAGRLSQRAATADAITSTDASAPLGAPRMDAAGA